MQKHYFSNPNGENVRKWDPKMVSKFHDDPMVDESEIIVLLGQIWVSTKKEKAQCEEHFFHHRRYLENPNDGCVKISSKPRFQIS